MTRNSTGAAGSGVPTKTIAAPDGSQIRYPNFPGLGEQHQAPNALPEHSHPQARNDPPTPPAQSTPPAPETLRERIMGAVRSAIERPGAYGHAAIQALVLDDWKALTDPHSSVLQRIGGAADLASWALPEGKIAEIAGHALAKVAEQAASHLATAGMERTAEHFAAAGALAAKWASRSENARIAGQHAANPSKIWDRPLTEAERRGVFENKHDLTSFLGPATKRGDVPHDWHHVGENHTQSRFGAELVQNINNVVRIPRHPNHHAISDAFNETNRLLPRDNDGNFQSLRSYLKDKPWEQHVAEGEQKLIDYVKTSTPAEMRAETLKRFEQRLQLHDRLVGQSKSVPGHSPSIVLPGVLTSIQDGPASRAQASGLHYERNGVTSELPLARRFEGRIESVDGDRIVQNLGRGGHTVTWSREELASRFNDSKAFDAMMQPGHYVNIGADRNGLPDVRQQLPDNSWQSLGNQQIPQHAIAHGHGR